MKTKRASLVYALLAINLIGICDHCYKKRRLEPLLLPLIGRMLHTYFSEWKREDRCLQCGRRLIPVMWRPKGSGVGNGDERNVVKIANGLLVM